jgi:hypothetical protein
VRLAELVSATGLRLDRTAGLRLPSGKIATEIDFLGAKGCRLSLFEVLADPEEAVTSTLTIEAEGDLLLAGWGGTSRYFLVSRGMDPTRFTTIASALSTAVIRSPAEDGDLVAMLSVAHQHCQA